MGIPAHTVHPPSIIIIPKKPPLDHPACFSLYTPLGQDFWTGILDCWASWTCIRNVEDYGSRYRMATSRAGLSKRGGLRGLTLIWVSFKQMFHRRHNYWQDKYRPEKQTRAHLKEKTNVFLRRWNSMRKGTRWKRKWFVWSQTESLTGGSCLLHTRLCAAVLWKLWRESCNWALQTLVRFCLALCTEAPLCEDGQRNGGLS